MNTDIIKIQVEGSQSYAALHLYIQDYSDKIGIVKRPLVLICPGGGYEHTSDREAEPVALSFAAMGCHAAVLRYSVAPAKFPTSIKELAYAVKYIRDHADEWHVDRDKIIVSGASAGGHLAASLGCFWSSSFLSDVGSPDEIKPNGLLLLYPVITTGEYCHAGSVENISGGNEQLIEMLSLENQVSELNPPVFVWATFEDESVPVENTLMYAAALRKAKVSTELHIFPHGGHGYSLATGLSAGISGKECREDVAQWINLARKWIEVNYPIEYIYDVK